MSMEKGLKLFGEGGYAAVKKEMQQLHDRKVMQPIRQKDLSPEQKKEVLGYLIILKKKRCGKIKGRGCANGCKQRSLGKIHPSVCCVAQSRNILG